jgi:hypothetical protein
MTTFLWICIALGALSALYPTGSGRRRRTRIVYVVVKK